MTDSVDADRRVQETHLAAPEHNDEAANRTEANYGSIASEAGVATAPPKPSARVLAPDLLRGLLMVLQALDHTGVTMNPWAHGLAVLGESDGQVVDHWNDKLPWTIRMLTHLCAPGFMFLLGMGVVYFGRSRARLGWPAWRLALHFFLRGLAIAFVNFVLGLFAASGRVLILNIVLLALAVNYFIAGLVWLALDLSERYFARYLSSKSSVTDEASQALLPGRTSNSSSASNLLWHFNNALLLALCFVTLWWNIWLSPDHGRCGVDAFAQFATTRLPETEDTSSLWFKFWFYPVMHGKLLMSGFPPLAWLSPAFFGVLYGRLATARPWKPTALALANGGAALVLFTLFILTRVLRFGNLTDHCLRMPEHRHLGPDGNQYLAGFRSFFYTTKYPPDPAYIFYAMSLNLLLLAGFGLLSERAARRIPTLLTFGTSALFFYVAHLVVLGLFGRFVPQLFGREKPWLGWDGQHPMGLGPVGFFVMFFITLALLVPMCRAYGRFKSSKGPDSIWRFF